MFVFPVPSWIKTSYYYAPLKFGAPREGGRRTHAGCDLYAPINTPVYAIADGRVIQSPYPFYRDTWAIEIKHDGFIVRYGEVSPRLVAGIEAGASVRAGQTIGYIGRLTGINQSMLHLEMYSGAAQGPLTDKRNQTNKYKRRSDLIDPTTYLDRWRGSILNVPLENVGKHAASVREIQELLNRYGYSLAEDGLPGAKTHAAILDFQRRHGLKDDGIVGERTLGKLRAEGSAVIVPAPFATATAVVIDNAPAVDVTQVNAPHPAVALNTNVLGACARRLEYIKGAEMRGADVDAWKAFLIAQGLSLTLVTGEPFGPRTQAATIEFQRRHGIEPLGIVGPKTLACAISLGFKPPAYDPSLPVVVTPNTANGARELTIEQLAAIVSRTAARNALDQVNRAMQIGEINTAARRAAFLAQIAHESQGLTKLKENGPDSYFMRYEPGTAAGTNVGNTEPGDGARFKGRGMIQLTGRENYTRAWLACGLPTEPFARGFRGVTPVNPECAATPEVSSRIAAWFWHTHKNLNPIADQLPVAPDELAIFRLITRRINGGELGLSERLN